MIYDVGFPPTSRRHWAGAWSLYFGLCTFTDHNGCDSVFGFKQQCIRKRSYVDMYLAVTVMTIGVVVFVGQKLVREGIEPHPEPENLE